MNVPAEGIAAYLDALGGRPGVIISPPFPYLKEVASRIATAAQNCSDQTSGAFTGEVSASMIRDCGARFVIVGHSERRRLYGETDAIVARKIARALEANLTPILCVGEPQAERDGGRATVFVRAQLLSVVEALRGARDFLVTYEPVWAIGTGRNATGAMVAEITADVRMTLRELRLPDMPILYGGSVTPGNVEEIGQQSGVAGYLVGGACLDTRTFAPIVDNLTALRPA